MALDVSALAVYTDQIEMGLAKEILLQANTIKGDIVSIRYGAIGDKTALNVVKSTMYGVTSACGSFTDTGSTVMAQSLVQMCPIKFEQSICLDTLKKYWYDYEMERKFNTESLGKFEDVFVQNKLEATALEIDGILWRGASTSPNYTQLSATASTITGNRTLCDGFLQVAYTNSASTVNVTKSAITVSNAYGIVDSILASVSTNAPEILDNFNLYLSPADFQSYLTSLRTLNLYNYNTQAEATTDILHPGSIGMHVVRTNGLNGVASGTAIATTKENIWAVISAEEDLNFKMWFDLPADSLRLRAKIKIGTGYFQPELVVIVA